MLTEYIATSAAMAFFQKLDRANNGEHNGVSLTASMLIDHWCEDLDYRTTYVTRDENTERVYGYGIPSVYE